jgi:hypothetical protein
MIILAKKKYDPDVTLAEVLTKFTKPQLKEIMNRFRYDISTSARKADYVRCTAKVILQHPNEVLYSLCAESIDILATLLHAKEGTFVACPHVIEPRDIQKFGLVLTYPDYNDATQYLTLPKDVRDAYTPLIDDYRTTDTYKLQKEVEPYIVGLSNLLGLCPLPLLEDTLKRDGINISQSDLKSCRRRAIYKKLIGVGHDSAPVPYQGLGQDISYIPSLYFDTDNHHVFDFLFDKLAGDGILHLKYREFTREEILAAGKHVPDFTGQYAQLLKNIYRAVGYSDIRITSILADFWQSHVHDDQENEHRHMHLNDENLQYAYEEFCKEVPRWACRGFCDTPTEGEFDEINATVEKVAKELLEKYENMPEANSPDVKFGSVFTHHPEEKPEDEEIEQDIVFKKVVRFTLHHENDIYWQAYLISEDSQCRLIANFGHAFDFISAPYKDGDLIDISRATEKKYPMFAKLAPIYEIPVPNKPYLNTIGFNGNPKTWCLMQTLQLDSNEWFDIAYGHLVDVYVEEFDETLNKFYEISVALLRELMRSDSKKAQEGVKELLG